MLYVETMVQERSKKAPTDGKGGSLYCTGTLGEVMKESSSIAYSFAKGFVLARFPENSFFAQSHIHLHVPEGATPKDGK